MASGAGGVKGPGALLTVDEARAGFVASALGIIRRVDCDLERMAGLLSGEGRATGLPAEQRELVSAHRLLLRRLEASGLGWLVVEELEGLNSLLEHETRHLRRSRAS